jgi:hypothetical protein
MPDAEKEASDEEVKALRSIEQTMRSFIERFDVHPEWHWAPATVRMVNQIKPHLRQLDQKR